jgi:hypothetical protein
MSTDSNAGAASAKMVWIGRLISALPVLMLIFSASMKLSKSAAVVKGFQDFGYAEKVILPLGIVELLCVVLYVIPKTSVLGAILITGYLGGAIATHVRAADGQFFMPAVLGVLVWAGLYCRDVKIRALVPWRS